jgi:hypothetical protein
MPANGPGIAGPMTSSGAHPVTKAFCHHLGQRLLDCPVKPGNDTVPIVMAGFMPAIHAFY